MASVTCFPFLDLPAELRSHIYHYAVGDWTESQARLRTISATMPELDEDSFETLRSTTQTTPRVFLLNRQIYREARVVLEKKAFIISEPKLWVSEQNYNWATSLSAISSRTLATILEVRLRIRSIPQARETYDTLYDDWIDVFDMLDNVCQWRRRKSPRLQRLILEVGSETVWPSPSGKLVGIRQILIYKHSMLNLCGGMKCSVVLKSIHFWTT